VIRRKREIERESVVPTVLVVDERSDNVDLVRRALTRSGYHVEAAGNIADGISTARSSRPDLILCDVAMPGGHSLKLVGRLRSDPDLSSIPVGMMTWGSLTRHWERAARAAGVSFFVARPVDSADLLPLLAQTGA
jgi:CheY-like chemotaxis protein